MPVIEVQYTSRWIDDPHMGVQADGIQACCLELLHDVWPERRNREPKGVEFTGAMLTHQETNKGERKRRTAGTLFALSVTDCAYHMRPGLSSISAPQCRG